ncbi:hypothetical protein HDU90_007432 [Geranomyces variabilis]|nr:hypothetical protein HDU90_007432 [Geranomyces variabilis]
MTRLFDWRADTRLSWESPKPLAHSTTAQVAAAACDFRDLEQQQLLLFVRGYGSSAAVAPPTGDVPYADLAANKVHSINLVLDALRKMKKPLFVYWDKPTTLPNTGRRMLAATEYALVLARPRRLDKSDSAVVQ